MQQILKYILGYSIPKGRVVVAALLILSGLASAQNRVAVQKTPPMRNAVSGHYAGWLMDNLRTWGGCNFPYKSCADGGTKVFYPKAYGASVQVPEGTVLIGGTDGASSIAECLLYNAVDGKGVALPSLPVGLDNICAAYGEKRIWVAGGQSKDMPNRTVYALEWPGGKKWVSVGEIPDSCRLQPQMQVMTMPYGKAVCIFGGYQPKQDFPKMEAKVWLDGICMNVSTGEWKRTSQSAVWVEDSVNSYSLVREAIVGCSSMLSGYSHVLFVGGVDYNIFLSAIQGRQDSMYLRHNPSWYHFRKDVLVYHTITDSWTLLPGDTLLARAGACLTPEGNRGTWLLSGGETMPGVRSADVTRVIVTHDTSFGWLNWTVLILYLVAMLGMGFYFMRREGGAEDFFRGGGRVPWWAAGISIYATMLSALTYMGIPAKAYTTDWTYYPMLWMIPIVGLPVIKYYLPYFRKLKAASAYEILEDRFNLPTRLMASALFCIFMIARMALVLYLPSLALTAVTGIDIYICIVLMGLVTIIYCTMGGVEAVIWGDVVQGIILVGGAFLAAGYLIFHTAGGFDGYIQIAMDADKFRLFDFSNGWTNATWWVVILGGGIANNLISYTSDQTVIQRYMTTPDEKSAGRSIMTNGFMSVFISVVFYIIGTGLYTFFKTHPGELDVTMHQADAIFPFFMMSQLPAGLAGLLIAAIFAATMSTISANINSVSTAFSVDFVQRFRPSTTDKQLLNTARYTSVVSGIIGLSLAILMATWNIQSVIDYFNVILGLLTSGLGGLFFVAVFLPRVKGYAALIGFVAGEVAVFCLNYLTDANLFLFGLTGVVVCTLVSWLVSFVIRK